MCDVQEIRGRYVLKYRPRPKFTIFESLNPIGHNLIIDHCDREPTRTFFATSLYRGKKFLGIAKIWNQEARGATLAKRIP